jgi:hypothetical protein
MDRLKFGVRYHQQNPVASIKNWVLTAIWFDRYLSKVSVILYALMDGSVFHRPINSVIPLKVLLLVEDPP